MTSKLVAISPFASSENSGHPIIDDQFYFAYLIDRGEDFVYYTSAASARLILMKHASADQHLRIVKPYREYGSGHLEFARQLIIPRGARVIFFLYTEELILTWYLLNLLKPFTLFLVSSNNISARRVRLYPNRLRIFFFAIKAKFRRLVLDSTFQVELLRGLSRPVSDSCFVRKNHLMCRPLSIPAERGGWGSISISYFGPDKPEKPLSTLIQLIKADVGQQFYYRIYNVQEEAVIHYLDAEQLPPNVTVDSSWQTREDYLRNYMASDLVILTHTQDFEGKLSGNLCDCVSLGVPYISLPIEPIESLHSKYGGLGYLCDFRLAGWAETLLMNIDQERIKLMRQNFRRMSEDYTVEAVRQTLDQAFEIKRQ